MPINAPNAKMKKNTDIRRVACGTWKAASQTVCQAILHILLCKTVEERTRLGLAILPRVGKNEQLVTFAADHKHRVSGCLMALQQQRSIVPTLDAGNFRSNPGLAGRQNNKK